MNLMFPFLGLNKGRALNEQPAATSVYLNNVRPYDVLGNRLRGGQRPGLDKLYTQQIGGSDAMAIVAVCSVTKVS